MPGDIVHIEGRVLGRHAGVIHYTIGQRRGLGLGALPAVGGEPLYVVRLDAAKAQVIVGPRKALATRRVRLRGVNWIGDGSLADLPRRAWSFVSACVRRAPRRRGSCRSSARRRSSNSPAMKMVSRQGRRAFFMPPILPMRGSWAAASSAQPNCLFGTGQDPALATAGRRSIRQWPRIGRERRQAWRNFALPSHALPSHALLRRLSPRRLLRSWVLLDSAPVRQRPGRKNLCALGALL